MVINMSSTMRESSSLVFPPSSDGNVKYLFDNLNMYMFVYHNAAHNKPGPFIRRYPLPGREPIVSLFNEQHTPVRCITLKREKNNKLWFKVDGKLVLETTDFEAHTQGKITLRIREKAFKHAGTIIKNMKIYSK